MEKMFLRDLLRAWKEADQKANPRLLNEAVQVKPTDPLPTKIVAIREAA